MKQFKFLFIFITLISVNLNAQQSGFNHVLNKLNKHLTNSTLTIRSSLNIHDSVDLYISNIKVIDIIRKEDQQILSSFRFSLDDCSIISTVDIITKKSRNNFTSIIVEFGLYEVMGILEIDYIKIIGTKNQKGEIVCLADHKIYLIEKTGNLCYSGSK